MAKEGTILGKISCTTPQPGSYTKKHITDFIYTQWGNEWTASPHAKHSKHFYGGPNKHKAKFVYKLARLELGRFVRVITGHNNLNAFQTKIGLWGSAVCRFCNAAAEDMLHLLHECPRFHNLRRDTFLDQPPDPSMQWSVRKVLAFSFSPGINEALEGTWAHGDRADLAIMHSSFSSRSDESGSAGSADSDF